METAEVTFSPKKRIMVADDHSLVAEGIASIVSQTYEVVGIVPDGRKLVAEALRLRPDLIVLDISMPELNGIEAARQVYSNAPRTKIVFVTQRIDRHYLHAAFHAGASGFVSKQCASHELMNALRRVAMGGTYITPLLEEKIAYLPITELRKPGSATIELTMRQREVLQLIAEGKTSREIATSLDISPKTVEFHKKSLMDQTGLRTTAELTRYAIAHRIVSL